MKDLIKLKEQYDTESKRFYSLKTKKAKERSRGKVIKIGSEIIDEIERRLPEGTPIPAGNYTFYPMAGGGMGGLRSDGERVLVHCVYSTEVVVSYPAENNERHVCRLPILEGGVFGQRNLLKLLGLSVN